MSETIVRRLVEEDWTAYRDLRLRALKESPEAFVKTYDEEKEYDEELWRARMRRADRLIASRDGEDLGVLSMRPAGDDFDESAEIFGLWVPPEHRGTGLAVELMDDAMREAKSDGHKHLVYWVGTDNSRGIGFATGRGFRPTEERRPMYGPNVEDGEEEIALILSLS